MKTPVTPPTHEHRRHGMTVVCLEQVHKQA